MEKLILFTEDELYEINEITSGVLFRIKETSKTFYSNGRYIDELQMSGILNKDFYKKLKWKTTEKINEEISFIENYKRDIEKSKEKIEKLKLALEKEELVDNFEDFYLQNKK